MRRATPCGDQQKQRFTIAVFRSPASPRRSGLQPIRPEGLRSKRCCARRTRPSTAPSTRVATAYAGVTSAAGYPILSRVEVSAKRRPLAHQCSPGMRASQHSPRRDQNTIAPPCATAISSWDSKERSRLSSIRTPSCKESARLRKIHNLCAHNQSWDHESHRQALALDDRWNTDIDRRSARRQLSLRLPSIWLDSSISQSASDAVTGASCRRALAPSVERHGCNHPGHPFAAEPNDGGQVGLAPYFGDACELGPRSARRVPRMHPT